ncbi:MAG: hypothetical protein HY673_25370 [Chloroflexi bacterium]|nr:hypothetical protein [Chloroflexota bacterium]
METMPEADVEAVMERAAGEVVALLTTRPETGSLQGAGDQLPESSVEVSDSLEAVYQLVTEKRWGDGLPVTPPTPERVKEMLGAAGRAPDEVLGEMPPAGAPVTLEKLAVNAVMAGCLPDYFPVVAAAVEAMLAPEFNLLGIQCTTNPAGPLVIVNGPVRQKLGINCTDGCMGPGWRANAAIGRAIRLILINIGGGLPGEVDRAVQGMPGKYTFCFGEDEEGSPWSPLHVERGFRKEDSAVTVVGVQGTCNSLCRVPRSLAFLRLAASSMCYPGNNNMVLGGGEPLVAFTAGHARMLAADGFDKAGVKEFLFEHARVPLSQLFPEGLGASGIAGKGQIVVDGTALPCRSAGDIMIVIAGARKPHHLVTMPTFGETRAVTRPVRIK